MLQTIVNAWKIADLRKKMIYTALIILIFRIGSAIPVPFTDIGESGIIGDPNAGTFMNYLAMMTGDAFTYGTIFAMSITPYINSSIIMQLLAVAIPALERLQKEGEEGRKKIASITRFVTIGLGLLQSTAYYFYLRSQGYLVKDASGADFTGFAAVFQAIVIILCFTAGTALIMWLGERINEKGIGNGISMILFAGIVSRIPTLITTLFGPENGYIRLGGPYYFLSPFVAICLILMIAFIVWMDNAERRIPVQYAKRVVGRKMYGGQSTHIPIKVTMAGVIPIIFAMSLLAFPSTVVSLVSPNAQGGFAGWVLKFFNQSNPWYAVIYFILIVAFTYFYTSITFSPIEVANNMKKNGGFIPGIRPGKPTSDFISKVLSRITLVGAFFLGFIAILPIVLALVDSRLSAISIGGTSLLIVVGVALETVKQMESQMLMRHYKGFLE